MVVIAAILFGSNLTTTCLALGLALLVPRVIAPPISTLFHALARLILGRRLHYHRVTGKCTGNVAVARHELAIADLAFEAHTTAVTACREMNESSGGNPGAVRLQSGCFPTFCDVPAPLWVKLFVSELLTSR